MDILELLWKDKLIIDREEDSWELTETQLLLTGIPERIKPRFMPRDSGLEIHS